MRVLISGGGTGGHVYPALAVVDQLPQAGRRPVLGQELEKPQSERPAAAGNEPVTRKAGRPPEHEVLWIGGIGGMEQALVERAGVDYVAVNTGQITGVGPIQAAGNLGKIGIGVSQSMGILRKFQPSVCLVTGGYVCAPVVVACRMARVPVLIYLPDMTPGSAIKALSRLATRVAVSFPEVAEHFGGEVPGGKAVVTGYPVRQDLIEAAKDRRRSRGDLAKLLALPIDSDDGLPLVLIWGGSQGARSINQATWAGLDEMLPHAHLLHVVGERDWPLYGEDRLAMLSGDLRARYHPIAYLHEGMPFALAGSDLTVARAGASSLGEFPIARLPSILVPLPHGGVNQDANARLLGGKGAALVIEDANLPDQLVETVVSILADDERLLTMTNAAGALANPDAADAIAQALLDLSS